MVSVCSIREVTLADLDRCYEIETSAYAGDEAASKAKIRTRINTYPTGFIVLQCEHEVVGFINAGATHQVALSDESFKELIGHDAKGAHVVIMSVVVDPTHQGKGYAQQLLTAFISRMRDLGKRDIFLICQTELIPLYRQHGFVHLGESNSEHGGLSWHEMSLTL